LIGQISSLETPEISMLMQPSIGLTETNTSI
jgi:hypothetical protein